MRYECVKSPTFFEGEADLKWIRDNIYCGGYGIRTSLETYQWMSDSYDMKIIPVKMTDERLYHFDCQFIRLSSTKALVATHVLSSIDIKNMERFFEIVSVPHKHIYSGWTNGVIVGKKYYHAPPSDGDEETESGSDFMKFILRLGFEPQIVNLSEFEKSGADSSCAVMRLNEVY